MIKWTFVAILLLLVLLGVALRVWRMADLRADRTEADRLIQFQPKAPEVFDPKMVADLPEPVRRFFTFAIKEGTPLNTVARLEMRGRIGLGSKESPNYMSMTATQVLASPEGFIWSPIARRDAIRMSGSDSGNWTRFWLAGFIPVVRAGGTSDHQRSAFGRYVAEAVFWTPAAVLPGPGVTWEALDQTSVRVTVQHGALEQAVDLTIDADGRPTKASFDRWTNANPDGVFRLQRFGGYLSKHREFGGFMLPAHVEAGNQFDTDGYFPSYVADIEEVSFPSSLR